MSGNVHNFDKFLACVNKLQREIFLMLRNKFSSPRAKEMLTTTDDRVRVKWEKRSGSRAPPKRRDELEELVQERKKYASSHRTTPEAPAKHAHSPVLLFGGPTQDRYAQARRPVPTPAMRGLKARFFTGENASAGPVLGLIGGLFLIGYTLDYQHCYRGGWRDKAEGGVPPLALWRRARSVYVVRGLSPPPAVHRSAKDARYSSATILNLNIILAQPVSSD
ncbi:hypothetical protein DFH09DRAFT_1090786 [Mycena vulgaris]|nr:hypothetical protein DFH09DRAFT_1090786 [Mycena vulgaris]